MNKFSGMRMSLGRLALFGSLALNVALAGFIGSQWVMAERQPLVSMPPRQLLARATARLPEKDAELLRATYAAHEPQFVQARAEFLQAAAKSVRLLAQPEVDIPTLRAAVLEAREKRSRQGDVLIEAFLEFVAKASPEARRSLGGRWRAF